jgi:hypothetical protein
VTIIVVFAGGIAIGRAQVSSLETPHWRPAGALAQPRSHATAVALATGEILIVGGVDPANDTVALSTAELFDPRTGATSVLPQKVLGRVNHTATIGWAGRVVVAGGTERYRDDWYATDVVDVYLPYARVWQRSSPIPGARSDHGAAALLDGRIFVTGGNDGPRFVKSSAIYEPWSDRWKTAAPLPHGRTQFTIATLPNGLVLVAGGIEENGLPSKSSLLYDPRANTWSEGPELAVERVLNTAVSLPGGDLLLVGGQRAAAGTAERYEFRDNRFVLTGTLADPRMLAAAAALPDGRVVVAGGLAVSAYRRDFRPMAAAEIWDPQTNAWSDIEDPASRRAFASLVATPFGVFQLGGSGENEQSFADIERLSVR